MNSALPGGEKREKETVNRRVLVFIEIGKSADFGEGVPDIRCSPKNLLVEGLKWGTRKRTCVL